MNILKNNSINIVRLSGKNVDLCTFRTDNEAINYYVRWLNESSILKWIGHNKDVMDFKNETEWAEKVKNDAFLKTFNIVEKNSDKLIGNCDIQRKGISDNYELGILIGDKDCRNKGYGTEVINLLLDFCFMQLKAHVVYLHVVSENGRALRCYKKCGFKESGRNREYEFYDGHYADRILMDILDREYFEIRGIKEDY